MKKTVLVLMILTVVSKVLGFTRDITLSYYYGATSISDIFIISLTIPTFIFAFIGQGIATGYIPMYSRVKNNDGIEKAASYTNNLINLVLLSCTVIIVIGLLFTEPIVKLFASGFEGDVLHLATVFTRITLLGIYFTALVYIFSSYLQIKGFFYVQGLMGLPFNLFFIAFIIISAKTNVYVLAIGSLMAIASQLLLIMTYAYKKQYRYKWIVDVKDENIKKLVVLALPAIFGASITQINILIDRTIASMIIEGGISALSYANTLSSFVVGIFVLSISTVIFPKISKMAVENNLTGIKKATSDAIIVISLLVIPATVGYMFFAKEVVQLLFGRGAFDETAISMTAYALFFYAIGIIGLGIREVLSKTFYSLHDVKTPMYNAAFAMVINIILNIILSKYLGVGGLALATSISAIICMCLLFISLKRKIGRFGMRGIAISAMKILIASLLMGVSSKHLYPLLTNYFSLAIAFFIMVSFAVLVYLTIILFMKIENVDEIVYEMKRKLENFRKKEEPPNQKLKQKI